LDLLDNLTRKNVLLSMDNVKKMTVGEFKSRFSKAVEWVKSGKKIAVTYGRKKEVVGYFIPESGTEKAKRELGGLKNRAKMNIHDDFKITEEELLKS